MKNNKETLINEIPDCQFCKEKAEYDGITKFGAWAYMCELHYKLYGKGLGLGKGQRLKTMDLRQ